MSSDKLNYVQLLQATFDNGTVHFKLLEHLLKSLVTKLDIGDEFVDDKSKFSTKHDPVVKAIPSPHTLKNDICGEKNTIEDMINIVNITKRVEALEISMNKLTSLVQTLIIEQRKRIDSDDEQYDGNQHVRIKNIEVDKNEDFDDTQKIKEECSIKGPKSTVEKLILDDLQPIELIPNPLIFSLSPLRRLEKAFKQKSSQVSDEKFANLCDLRELERHIKQQFGENIITTINSNQFYLSKQICDLQKLMEKVESQITDVFFACEQNDGSIEDVVLSLNEFNEKIFCLKSDVKELKNDSKEFRENFSEIGEKFEEAKKENNLYVDEKVHVVTNMMFEEMNSLVKIDKLNEIIDVFRMRISMMEGNHQKFHSDMKKSLTTLIVGLEDKLSKNELRNFKDLVASLFDDFVTDIRILFYKISQNAISAGASKSLQSELNCISCDSKVSMTTTFPQLENSSTIFKNKLFKVKVNKKSARTDHFRTADVMKIFAEKKVKKNLLTAPQFPLSSQQCYIVCKDNTIVKADPLKYFLKRKEEIQQ